VLLRFVLQTLAIALTLWLITVAFPGVAVSSTGVLVASAALVGLANAAIRPLLRFALHPVTVAWIALIAILVNVLAVLLGPSLTMSWAFASFGAAAATVVVLSAVSVITAAVPLTRSDRSLSWGLNEPKTPGAGPIERRPQLEDEPETAH
jgi:putative membrane protein